MSGTTIDVGWNLYHCCCLMRCTSPIYRAPCCTLRSKIPAPLCSLSPATCNSHRVSFFATAVRRIRRTSSRPHYTVVLVQLRGKPFAFHPAMHYVSQQRGFQSSMPAMFRLHREIGSSRRTSSMFYYFTDEEVGLSVSWASDRFVILC